MTNNRILYAFLAIGILFLGINSVMLAIMAACAISGAYIPFSEVIDVSVKVITHILGILGLLMLISSADQSRFPEKYWDPLPYPKYEDKHEIIVDAAAVLWYVVLIAFLVDSVLLGWPFSIVIHRILDGNNWYYIPATILAIPFIFWLISRLKGYKGLFL